MIIQNESKVPQSKGHQGLFTQDKVTQITINHTITQVRITQGK